MQNRSTYTTHNSKGKQMHKQMHPEGGKPIRKNIYKQRLKAKGEQTGRQKHKTN